MLEFKWTVFKWTKFTAQTLLISLPGQHCVDPVIWDAKHNDSAHAFSPGWVCPAAQPRPEPSSLHVELRHFYRVAQCLGTSLFRPITFQARIKRVSTLLSVEWKTLISLWVTVDRGQRHCTSDLFTWLSSRLPQSKQDKGAICKTNMAAGWHWLCSFYVHDGVLGIKLMMKLTSLGIWKKRTLYYRAWRA